MSNIINKGIFEDVERLTMRIITRQSRYAELVNESEQLMERVVFKYFDAIENRTQEEMLEFRKNVLMPSQKLQEKVFSTDVKITRHLPRLLDLARTQDPVLNGYEWYVEQYENAGNSIEAMKKIIKEFETLLDIA